jgi:hypothetical protein
MTWSSPMASPASKFIVGRPALGLMSWSQNIFIIYLLFYYCTYIEVQRVAILIKSSPILTELQTLTDAGTTQALGGGLSTLDILTFDRLDFGLETL